MCEVVLKYGIHSLTSKNLTQKKTNKITKSQQLFFCNYNFHTYFFLPNNLLALGPCVPAYDGDWFMTTLCILPNFPKYSCFLSTSTSANRKGRPTTNTRFLCTTLTLIKKKTRKIVNVNWVISVNWEITSVS